LKVAIVATGGTIAGYSIDRLNYSDYKDMVPIDVLLEAIPESKSWAELHLEQIESISSSDMTPDHWRLLKQKVESYLVEQDYDGVVITHGTNTLEETAYYLHLTVKTKKPVVIVGSQRPFSALGSDASINLLNAIRVAVHPDSMNKGVLVMLNEEINGAREVTKTNTYRVQTFQSGQIGILGYADLDGTVQYYRTPIRTHTLESCFNDGITSEHPHVGIVYSYAGADGQLIRWIADSGRYAGIVMAGTGAGMLSKQEESALKYAIEKGVLVVRGSRVGNGRVLSVKDYDDAGFIYADNLLPQKARILLMLSIMKTTDRQMIQTFFNEY
jgi:L-asparaginase